ncbi:cytochrome P450 [Amycolatopsis sp. MEPSY49]|uniref:cytochrome P450 n=1 Tax=Amycolatopsis sp. MEPSY49 TaxID=3151600 RepID=UPI003EF237E8
MTTFADRWTIHEEHFWLRGRRPEQPVRFDEKLGMWHVYGYPEALAVLSDPETFSTKSAQLLPFEIDESVNEGNLLEMQGLEHRKLRKVVSQAFTPKMVAELEPRIAEITHELLDAVAGQSRIELVADLSYPLPMMIVGELLGLPADERPLLKRWMDKMSESVTGELSLVEGDGDQERTFRVMMEQTKLMVDYVRGHVAERRRNPRQDLLSQLVLAEVDGERLSDNTIASFAKMLLIAGHLTTTMLLGNTVLCLDSDPALDARVRGDRSLMPTVVDESMRFLPPVASTYRATTKEVELGGERIPEHQMVQVWFAAANRDERQFPHPDVFDPARDPNPHLGFGRSVHFCLGAPLARLEGRVALNILLDRFPVLRVDPDAPPTFFPAPDTTGVSVLPLRTV